MNKFADRFTQTVFVVFIVVALIAFAFLIVDGVTSVASTIQINNQFDTQYMQACHSNQGILIDNICVDPQKFEEAKIHLQIGS